MESIMELGLLPGTKAQGALRRIAGPYVYLCETAEDALQLAPTMGAFYSLRKYGEKYYNCPRAKYWRFEEVEHLVVLLSVDVSGLPLGERMNKAAEPWLYEGKTIPVKEYLCPKTISPDRILKVSKLSFYYKQLVGAKPKDEILKELMARRR